MQAAPRLAARPYPARALRRTRGARHWSPARPRWRVAVATSAVVILVMGAWLAAMGRPLICSCGTVSLWVGDVTSAQNSQQLADPYSFIHISFGVVFYWLLAHTWRGASLPARLIGAVVLAAGW
jgi:hypothetical protein